MLYRSSSRQYLRGSNQYVVRIRRRKPRIRVFFALAFLVAIYGYIALLNLISFSDKTFRFTAEAPTKLLSPLAAEAFTNTIATPSATPTPELSLFDREKAYIYTKPHADVIFRIWGLESSFGKQPFLYCTRRGLVSDMGFNVLNHQCFPSFQREIDTVNTWIDTHAQLSLGQILCMYNQGIKKQNCEYSSNFLSL